MERDVAAKKRWVGPIPNITREMAIQAVGEAFAPAPEVQKYSLTVSVSMSPRPRRSKLPAAAVDAACVRFQ